MGFSFVKVCPDCGGEFEESVAACPDCAAPLLVKPPETDQPIDLEAVFFEPKPAPSRQVAPPLPRSPSLDVVVETTLEHTQGLMAELAAAGIRFRVERTVAPDTRSLSPAFGIPADAGSYAVQVSAGDLEAARRIWDRYFRAQVPEGFSEPRQGSCPACGSFLTAGRDECPSCGLVVA